ncbi:MAG: DUF559 domain-containing protein [Roseivirga sp.]
MGNKPRIYYDKSLTKKACYLRNNSTLPEILLWNELKRGKIRKYDFHRQKPILHYIVDFFCYPLMLAIEVDGESHNSTAFEYDWNRQKKIEAIGISFLRFHNDSIKHDMANVLHTLHSYIDFHESTHP